MANGIATTKSFTNLLGDIRKTNNFVISIEDVTDTGNALTAVVTQAFIPALEIGVITLTHGNDSKTYAGQATWTGGNIVIQDVLNQAELDALIAWQEQVYDPATGAIGVAQDYKKQATLTEYAGNMKFIRRWEFPVWISGLTFGELDAANANHKQVTATLQVDPPSTLRPVYEEYGV